MYADTPLDSISQSLIRRETVIKYDKTTAEFKRISFMEYVKAPQNDE